MKYSEAEVIVAEIQRDYPHHIQAQIIETRRPNDSAEQRYRVSLLLRPGQRHASVWTPDQWRGLKDAWQWFLPPTLPKPQERTPS